MSNMIDDNILFLKNFIGTEWLDSEFNKVNTRTPLKGAGTLFSTYHPWVHYMYELEYLLRRASIEKREGIFMGRYFSILNNAGMLLKENLDYIVDKKDAQMKLRDPEQFYGFMWELETRTMLSRNGAYAVFVDPQSGNSYDGSVTIANRPIPFECKNKILDNNRFNTNSVFTQVLSSKLGEVESIRNKIVQIEFENGRLEDVKTIAAIIRDKFDIYDYWSILGKYKVRTIKKIPFNTPSELFMNLEGINAVSQVGTVKKHEMYMENSASSTVKSKLLFKMPKQIIELNNLNNVLKKANSQLASGGIVFLQVPYIVFDNAKKEIEKELVHFFSNIYAVKLIAFDIDPIKNIGVEIRRLEELIVSENGREFLMQAEIDFLNKPMAFSKYKKEEQSS